MCTYFCNLSGSVKPLKDTQKKMKTIPMSFNSTQLISSQEFVHSDRTSLIRVLLLLLLLLLPRMKMLNHRGNQEGKQIINNLR